jgi:hypothetical protein
MHAEWSVVLEQQNSKHVEQLHRMLPVFTGYDKHNAGSKQ